MTATQRADLENAIDANVPVLLMGAPGTAKTAILESIAADRNMYLEVVIASAQDPTTILGIPMPSADRKYTEPTIPGWARRINEAAAAGRDTMLFLDELTTVAPAIAGPLLGVVQSRRSDGWTLPADTRIVAAANPPDLAVGGWAIEPAMANRWAHITWDAPVKDWCDWAEQQPSPTLKLFAEYHRTVGGMLLQVPQDYGKRSGPWPSPRSWTNAARIIDTQGGGNWSLAAMAVGDAAAMAFAQWARQRDVPTPEQLIDGSKALPDRPDAFVSSLAALVAARTDDNHDRIIEILLDAVRIDPYQTAVATKALSARNARGVAAVTTAIKAAGIDMGTVRA